MAKVKGSNSIKRNDIFFVDLDTKKIIEKLEKAGKDTKRALERAALRGLPLIEKEFKDFIQDHRVTGETESSLMSASDVQPIWGKVALKKWVGTTTKGKKGFTGGQVKVVNEDDVMFLQYGFRVNKEVSGLPALFLDIGVWENGSPRQAPTFFMFYAVERNIQNVQALQKEELMKIVEGLI